MTRLRSQNRDLTPLYVAIAVGAATYLIGCHLARAGVAANPSTAMEAGGNAALDVLAKDGPWWAAVGVVNVALRLWLDHQHWLKQGRLLTALTSLSAVLVATASWHWDGGPSVGILTAVIAGGTLLLHPAPPAPPAKPGPLLVTSLLVALVACTASQAKQVASAGTVAFLECEDGHLDAAALADAKALASAELRHLFGGPAPDTTALKLELGTVKSDLGRCAWAAAVAAFGAVVQPQPGTAVSALVVAGPDPAQVRAAFAVAARQLGWAPMRVGGAVY